MIFSLAHAVNPLLAGLAIPATQGVLERHGHCTLDLWPYDPNQADMTTLPAGEISRDAATRLATLNAIGNNSSDIESALHEGMAVAVIMHVFRQLFYPQAGFIANPQSGDILSDSHAFLIVGLIDHPGHGRVFVIRNSWGTAWGELGHGFIEPSVLDHQVLRALMVVPTP